MGALRYAIYLMPNRTEHLVLLELIIDPLCSIVFEGEPSEGGAMRRPPRNAREPLFGSAQIAMAALQGTILLASVLVFYLWMSRTGVEAGEARAASFVALVAGHLALAPAVLATNARTASRQHRWMLWLITAGTSLLLLLMLAVPELREIMRFSVPTARELSAGLAIGIVAGAWSIVRIFDMVPDIAAGGSKTRGAGGQQAPIGECASQDRDRRRR